MRGIPEYCAHAAEYRAQAAACMRNAEKGSNQAILLTAHMWLRMADEAEFINTKVSD